MNFKKNLVAFLLLIVCFFSVLSFANFNVHGYSNGIEELQGKVQLGTYERVEQQNVLKKIFITPELKKIFDETGVNYTTETTKHYFLGIHIKTTYRYYYYDYKYVDVVVSSRSLSNDIDSLIYMVSELEYYANRYKSKFETSDVVDLVAGYIRGINKSYYSEYMSGITWSFCAGNIDENFIKYVNDNDTSSNVKIRDYFANFLEKSQYNKDVYGAITDINIKYGTQLIDPLNPYNYAFNKIDLIHMFATIDGTYKYTDASILSLEKNFQRDLAGWAGDLQAFTRYDIYTKILNGDNVALINYFDESV